MSDTPWPRFYVFKQDETGKPHLNCGSLHAPDPEMALLNARDVFVRRPDCVSLWVIGAEHVHARTQESLAADPPQLPSDDGGSQTFEVFLKTEWRKQQSHAGQVQADSAQAAMAKAVEAFADSQPLEIWVTPKDPMATSPIDQADAWFAPARDKPYRHGAYYLTDSLMRQIMKGGNEG